MTDIVCQDERKNLQIIDKENIFQMLKWCPPLVSYIKIYENGTTQIHNKNFVI
jgi:hypothetical protein